mgnify:CR=1 FL=1
MQTPLIKISKKIYGKLETYQPTGSVKDRMIEYICDLAIAAGNIHLQTEVWTNNVGDLYPDLVEKGDIIVVGELGLEPKEGWIYPPYMKEKCPGLPNYKALYDCAMAFGRADTFPKGRLIT